MTVTAPPGPNRPLASWVVRTLTRLRTRRGAGTLPSLISRGLGLRADRVPSCPWSRTASRRGAVHRPSAAITV